MWQVPPNSICEPDKWASATATSKQQHQGTTVLDYLFLLRYRRSPPAWFNGTYPLHSDIGIWPQARLAHDGKVASLPAISIGVLEHAVRHAGAPSCS